MSRAARSCSVAGRWTQLRRPRADDQDVAVIDPATTSEPPSVQDFIDMEPLYRDAGAFDLDAIVAVWLTAGLLTTTV